MKLLRNIGTLVLLAGLAAAGCEVPDGVDYDAKCAALCKPVKGVCINLVGEPPPLEIDASNSTTRANPEAPDAQCCEPPSENATVEETIKNCTAAKGKNVSDVARYQSYRGSNGMMMSMGCKSNVDCTKTPMTPVCNVETEMCIKKGFDCRTGDMCTGTQSCDPANGMCKNPPMENQCTEAKGCEPGKVCVAGTPNLCLGGHCSGVNGKDVFGRPAGALNNPYCGNGGKGDVSGACKVGTCKEGQRLGVSSELDLSDCAPGTNGRKWHANDIGVPAEIDPQATYCLKGN